MSVPYGLVEKQFEPIVAQSEFLLIPSATLP